MQLLTPGSQVRAFPDPLNAVVRTQSTCTLNLGLYLKVSAKEIGASPPDVASLRDSMKIEGQNRLLLSKCSGPE